MEKILFKNNFGLLFESHFSVMQSGFMKDYSYHNFRKVRLYKTRNYQHNILLFLVSVGIAVLGFWLRSYDPLMVVLGVAVSSVLLFLSFRTKKYRYQLQMVTVNYEPIVVEVASLIHEDAKAIVRKLNRKINEQSSFLKAV
ncbi:MAG: hypothetical protein RL607_1877 [Bacteroidota bacterium]|jgi:uncharacterized membrane protein